MYRGRGLLFPLLLIGIGVIVLLVNTGVLSQDALQRLGALWPLLLVILGLQLILNHTLPRRQATWVGLAATVIIVTTAVLYASLAPAASLATATSMSWSVSRNATDCQNSTLPCPPVSDVVSDDGSGDAPGATG